VSRVSYTGGVKAAAAAADSGSGRFRPSRSRADGGGRASQYREALSGLNSAQKPGNGVPAYTRWVNRRLGRYAAAAAYALHWTPNAVTALSAAFSFAAIVLLLVADPQPWVGIAVAVLLATGYLLDSADGQVARLQGSGSPAGEWLDHVVDALRAPAIHLAVLIGFWNQQQPPWGLAVALVYCLVTVVEFMSQILAEQLAKQHSAPTPAAGLGRSFLLLPTDTGTFCWMFLVWGFPALFVVAYTAMLVMNTVHTAISMRRKYLKLKQAGNVGRAAHAVTPAP
jgi:phosphatidylglycerophosphate synthase